MSEDSSFNPVLVYMINQSSMNKALIESNYITFRFKVVLI